MSCGSLKNTVVKMAKFSRNEHSTSDKTSDTALKSLPSTQIRVNSYDNQWIPKTKKANLRGIRGA